MSRSLEVFLEMVLPYQHTLRRSNMLGPIFSMLSCPLFLLSQNTPYVAASHSPKVCPPSSCGNLHNITNPFRLRSDPPECGDPNYELVCEGINTVLYLDPATKYLVTEISYDNSTIRLVDVEIASGRCTLPNNFRYEDHEDGYFFMGTNTWASFMNCSEEIHDRMNSRAVPCLSRNGTSSVYVIDDYDADLVASLLPRCHFITKVPTAGTFEEYAHQDVFQILRRGFLLFWNQKIHLSHAEIIRSCIKEAKRSIKRIIEDKTGLFLVISPVVFEIKFFNCLGDVDSFHNYVTHYGWLIIGLMLLADIVIYLTALAMLARFVFAPLSVLVFLTYKFWELQSPMDAVEKFLHNQQALSPTRYSYHDIIVMTNNFREKLGQGGFGSVFKGILPGSLFVAVKLLGSSKLNGEDFISEVSTISRIHHVNIVRLVGFCSEGEKRALIYEYMANGSLDKYIFSSNGTNRHFTMEKLNEIALGVARGIDYLHRGCDMRILHFDIKPHNILLDNNFNPKVSDFGLAKLYPKGYSLVSLSAARGTIGYIAPELVSRSFGVVSYKADVYSFGMLLMEMAGGRRNVDPRADNSSQVYYSSWIYDRLERTEGLENSDAIEIVDVERKLCKVGLWCIQMRPSDRPSMSRVIELLESEVDTLQLPPKPFLSNSRPMSVREPCGDSSFTELSIISESFLLCQSLVNGTHCVDGSSYQIFIIEVLALLYLKSTLYQDHSRLEVVSEAAQGEELLEEYL